MSKEFDYPRDFKGIWLPKEIWLDNDLSAIEKIIFSEIDSLDIDGSEGCYASNEYLANFCKCSITKVSTSISRLIELGYIKVVKTDGRKRWLKASLSKFESQTNKNKKSEIQEMKESNIPSNKDDKNIDKNSFNNSSKDMKRLSLEGTNNSPVSEEKQETRTSKTLGRKTHTPKQTPLKDMPTRAREITDRLVDDTETADKVSDCISYFLEQYEAHRRKEHIHLTNDKLQEVVETLLSTITIPITQTDGTNFENDYNPLVADNVDEDDMKWVVDQYFQTQFREKTDYSLVHFAQEGVLTNVMNKCMLGGNLWYQSHSL